MIAMEYSARIPAGGSISTKAVTAVDAAGTSATSTVIDSSTIVGKEVQAVVKAGSVGDYRITFTATLLDGAVLEEDVIMRVREKWGN